MTLFLGGPRHGQDNRVPTERPPLLDIATDQPRKLPASYVDLASASTYHLRPFTYVTGHPLTGRPDKTYTLQVYVHESASPAQATQLLGDAVLRRWFETEGTLQPAQAQSPPDQREPTHGWHEWPAGMAYNNVDSPCDRCFGEAPIRIWEPGNSGPGY